MKIKKQSKTNTDYEFNKKAVGSIYGMTIEDIQKKQKEPTKGNNKNENPIH